MSQRPGRASDDESPEHEPDDEMISAERGIASHGAPSLPSAIRSAIVPKDDDSPEHEPDE
jgi:hypothetical protein